MNGGFYLGNKTNRLASCPCCFKPKDRNGEPLCKGCQDAGCYFDCGWKRGGRKGHEVKGKPFCPAVARAKAVGEKRKKKRLQ